MKEIIGLIGVGLVGSALAERLTQAGFSLATFDVDPAHLSRLSSLGLYPRQSPKAYGPVSQGDEP